MNTNLRLLFFLGSTLMLSITEPIKCLWLSSYSVIHDPPNYLISETSRLNGRKVEFRSSENKEGIFGCGKVGFSVTVWLNICREGALDRFFLEKAITTSGEANDNFAHFDHSICRHQCGWLGFSTFQFILGFSSCWGITYLFYIWNSLHCKRGLIRARLDLCESLQVYSLLCRWGFMFLFLFFLFSG